RYGSVRTSSKSSTRAHGWPAISVRPLKGRHSTVAVHMPKAHQHYAAWTPQRLILWAAKTGEATAQVVETILASRPPPQQGYRACLGLMRLGKRYGEGRLEAACRCAIRI